MSPPESRIRVRGRVVDTGGVPVSDVAVGVVRVWPGGADTFALPTMFTSETGEFLVGGVPREYARIAFFPGLPPGTTAEDLSGWPVVLSRPVEPGTSNEVDIGDVVLGLSAPLGGVVCDAAGGPVQGARVVVGLAEASGLSRQAVLTDADGRFRFENLRPGKYFVHASFEFPDQGWQYRRLDGVEAGDIGLLLSLAPGSAVLLRFEAAERPGVPLLLRSGRLVRADSGIVPSFGAGRTPKPRDSWRVYFPPGRYQLRFESPGYLPVDLGQVVVDDGRDTELDITLTSR